MKKLTAALFLCTCTLSLTAQTTSTGNSNWKNDILEQPGDHFMISLTNDSWGGAPDSISSRIRSVASRGIAVALMINKPFKTDPRWAVAFGLGMSNSNIFFNRTAIDIAALTTVLPFRALDSAQHFKKYKLSTTFLEVPVELRYSPNPQKGNKAMKFALGVKVGTMLNVHTKGKTLRDKDGNNINNYTVKESKRIFFNGTRFAATARVGMGNFSLVGTYSLTSLLKDGAGPDIKPYQIGLCISGL
ncbi:MAG TPA: outer membrane beta-barrel protein [Ferruginibacter sp.]|nr:outer membrane beta-barrel protein [Ferruginibacter sp.]HMP19972.1 outer membrane beta-barrel protein [Ferruginibacter sp.]